MNPDRMPHPGTRQIVPMDDAMYELRVRLLPAFGYVIRKCSWGPSPDGTHRDCIETEVMDMTCPQWFADSGKPCSGYHATHESGGLALFPEEVQKAAHAIDKSKPVKVKK